MEAPAHHCSPSVPVRDIAAVSWFQGPPPPPKAKQMDGLMRMEEGGSKAVRRRHRNCVFLDCHQCGGGEMDGVCGGDPGLGTGVRRGRRRGRD